MLLALLPAPTVAAERAEREAEVAGLTRVAISGSEIQLLVLAFDDGGGVSIPDREQLPVSAGMRVRVDAVTTGVAGELPVACRIEVLAVPVDTEAGQALQWAARPFEVYVSSAAACLDQG